MLPPAENGFGCKASLLLFYAIIKNRGATPSFSGTLSTSQEIM
jgi:hypothetical protein